MKYTLTVITSLLFLTSAVGQHTEQADEDLKDRHRIGLNAIGIVDQILDSGDLGADDILITYRYDLGNMFLRAGIGPDYHHSETTHDGFTDRVDSTNYRVTGRIGVGFHVLTSQRWQVDAGIDLVGFYHLQKVTSDSGFDKVTDQVEAYGFGGGPFVTLTFQLNQHISLGTEAGLYARYSESTTTMLFENFPDFNDEIDNVKAFDVDAVMPATLFIQFHF